MTDIQIKDASESPDDVSYLLDVIEAQLSVIATLNDLEPGLYDDLAEDRIKTMSGAFRLIRDAQRKIMDEVKNLGKG